jgi:Zn-finger nucleic acid-binding protein
MNCPKCRRPLESRTVGKVEVNVCPDCTGTFLPMNRLVPLLETMAGPMLRAIDLNEPIEPVPDDGNRVACPKCQRAMEAFGYMGTNTVTLDRCSHDFVLWADAEELGTCSLLFARTNRRLSESQKKHDELRMSMARTTRSSAAGRAAAGRVAFATLMGGVGVGAAVLAAESLRKST